MLFTDLYGKGNSWSGVITTKTSWSGEAKKSLYLTSLLLIVGFIGISQISMSEQELKLGGHRNLLLRSNRLSKQNLPKKQRRRTKKYITEVTTYAVNDAKWKAANEYCKDRRWQFKILTEKELKI